jgi:hypothetical protein
LVGAKAVSRFLTHVTLLAQLLVQSPFRADWSKTVEISGWKPLPPKPRARFNAAAFAIRRQGYRTVGEVLDATGLSDTTFRRWEKASFIPRMPVVGGVRALRAEQFDSYVESCRRAYLVAATTRNKSTVQRADRREVTS